MGIEHNSDATSNPLDRNEIDVAYSVHDEEPIQVIGIIWRSTRAVV
jgi:hypothetical protein